MEIFISRGGRGDGTIFQGEKEKKCPQIFDSSPIHSTKVSCRCESSYYYLVVQKNSLTLATIAPG